MCNWKHLRPLPPCAMGSTNKRPRISRSIHGRLCAQAWRRTAQSVEALALSLQREVPDTAATMRLSGLELADAIGEVTLLGADLTEASRRLQDWTACT